MRPVCTFTQLAEPMTAPLADLRELPRSLSAFAAFEAHFSFPVTAVSLYQKTVLTIYWDAARRNVAKLLLSRSRRPATNLNFFLPASIAAFCVA